MTMNTSLMDIWFMALPAGVAGLCIGGYIPALSERVLSYKERKRGKKYEPCGSYRLWERQLYALGMAVLWISAICLFPPDKAILIQVLSVFVFSISYIDHMYRIIPNEIVMILLGTGVVHQMLLGGMPAFLKALAMIGLSIAICGLSALLVRSRGAVGAGDVKLLAAVALLTGYPQFMDALLLTSVSAAMYCLAGLYTGRMNWKSYFPMGSFIAGGMLCSFFAQWIFDLLLRALG